MTLNLDDEVMARIEDLNRSRRQSLEELAQQALRLGLAQMSERQTVGRDPYRLPVDSLGGCRIPSIDNVAEVLGLEAADD